MRGSHNKFGVIERPEEQWVSRVRDLHSAAGVYELALEVDASPAIAAGLSHWLVREALGRGDGVPPATLTRYRRILKRIDDTVDPDKVKRAMGVYLSSHPKKSWSRPSRKTATAARSALSTAA